LAEFKGGIVVVTHDEFLMYRMIQCNWSESELLICQMGMSDARKSLGHTA